VAKQVNYDAVAPAFDRRYRSNRFEGILATVEKFVEPKPRCLVEIGCGTGHWLKTLHASADVVIGLDPSTSMLRNARAAAPRASLVRGRAEDLPFDANTVDRMLCVNSLHHFSDPAHFVQQAFRPIRPGGGLLSIGLDPHTGLDQWWVYDYFPQALVADRDRYPSTKILRSLLRAAGFVRISTEIAQHIPAELFFDAAVAEGFLDRRSTSQFQVIDDEHWNAGVTRLHREKPTLRADLRLYATVAWHPSRQAESRE
jgi:ubiquinone/menaquinone biosynthesis C-methylase UbiE